MQPMHPNSEPRLCEHSPHVDEAWRKLYVQAFPEHEREPEDKLAKLVEAGKMVLHKTINAEGELVCFTMTSLGSDFALLAYMATDATKRSGGYGSKHLKRLLEILKAEHPQYVGLFLEIEATTPRTVTISDEERKVRKRRRAFYQRIGAKRMCRKARYLTPGRTAGAGEWEGELFCVPFAGAITGDQLLSVVNEILTRMYCLGPEDQLLQQVLTNFAACKPCTDPSSVATDEGKHTDAHPCDPVHPDTRQPPSPHICTRPKPDPVVEPAVEADDHDHAPDNVAGAAPATTGTESTSTSSECELVKQARGLSSRLRRPSAKRKR